jgi:signal transduction histidine kinase
VAQDLRVIEKHAQHCKRIVEDLLKFSRSSGTTKTPQDINALLQEVLAVVKSKFQVEKVKVVEELDQHIPKLTVDGDKMKQVFMNLLMNARQSITGQGIITVRTHLHKRKDKVLISFQDTGCGIPQEILHRIFDPFFTTKPVGVGTGLGLSVSYGIVRDHEGQIRVETALGKGSTFIVELPLEAHGQES